MKIAIYPGTFDPITMGHLDVAARVLKLVDKLIIAVADVDLTKPTFSCEERIGMVKSSLAEYGLDTEVDSFSGLLMDYASSRGAQMVVRGLRAMSDFEYEFQMALMNRRLAPQIEEVFLASDQRFIFLSSSLVKELASLGGDIHEFVAPSVEKVLREHFRRAE